MRDLRQGDVIYHRSDRTRTYVVHANYGNRVTAVCVADVTNASEREVAARAEYRDNDNQQTSNGRFTRRK